MSIERKIIITGHEGAGKTSAVRSLSDSDVVAIDAEIKDELKDMNFKSIVTLDYGEMILTEDEKLIIFGVPVHRRMNLKSKKLAEKVLGIVILVDGRYPEILVELRKHIMAFDEIIQTSTLVVGITHTDGNIDLDNAVRHTVNNVLISLKLPPLVMSVDARRREDTMLMIKTLLYSHSYELELI